MRVGRVVLRGLSAALIGIGLISALSVASPAGAVGGANATITTTTSPTSVVTGQPTTLDATVSGSDGVPTGTVTFTEAPTDSDSFTLCVATLQSGSGSCVATNLTSESGNNSQYPVVTAKYSGDDNYGVSNSYVTVSVSLAPTTMTLQSSANPVLPDTAFTVTANLSVNSPGAYTGEELSNLYVEFQLTQNGNPNYYNECDGPLSQSVPLTASCSFDVPDGVYVVSAQLMSGYVEGLAQPNAPQVLNEAVQVPAQGYWLVGSDGGIFSFGGAKFHGSMGGTTLNRPVVGITPTATDNGYWLVASDGGIFAFNAPFVGSLPALGYAPAGTVGGKHLDAPIVGMVPSPSGTGYFMVASDGGVFAFNAHFAGSCPGLAGGCSGAAVGVAPDQSGNGYWLATATGHVYAFGDAQNFGGPGPQTSSIRSIVRTPDGKGYWVLDANGEVFTFGDAQYRGAVPAGAAGGADPATAIFASYNDSGYWVATAKGKVYAFDVPSDGDASGTKLNGSIIAATGF